MGRIRRYQMTTQAQVRAAFWEAHPNADRRRGPYWETPADRTYCTDTRCAFVDYVDMLERDGVISTELAGRVTLC